eukprot:gnl/MRDRNA2_/MRDRNA2_86555_c1_seq2.p1 gnl/MRDRNA2_/MRDRNA2_86555_c1~~gnl/MRDRNA2_/MRDRNA2_86555_c1_seq2.p1  ORF type:complete len:384 (+),score=-17.34 gnl/MRDRNA2_/MRDRNA2_86555_c1_seq2:99-1250(+)
MFTPKIVRIGRNLHYLIRSMSISNIITKKNDSQPMRLLPVSAPEILDQATVVASTLSFSGSNVFANVRKPFRVIIIDEAAQATELSSLIPVLVGSLQIFMIGDHLQLPATVLSSKSCTYGYNISLMYRLMRSGHIARKLTVQYRMHPTVREFPAAAFYGGMLEDGKDAKKIRDKPWHKNRCSKPLVFYDIRGSEERVSSSQSYRNVAEADLVIAIYLYLAFFHTDLRSANCFGIISPYRGQVKLIRRKITKLFGSSIMAQNIVDVDTIDGYQGKEKDVVLFSTVRSYTLEKNSKIGFVADERRVNVALTRARASIILTGNIALLSNDPLWCSLIRHCFVTDRLIRIRSDYDFKLKNSGFCDEITTSSDNLVFYYKQIYQCKLS